MEKALSFDDLQKFTDLPIQKKPGFHLFPGRELH